MINRKDVEYVAKLARLELTEDEKEEFTSQLGAVVSHIDQLNEVDTSNVEPTAFIVPDHDPLRDDKEKESLPVDELHKIGPNTKKGHFAIPKVIN